jgi:flagellar hook-length control protein FliK
VNAAVPVPNLAPSAPTAAPPPSAPALPNPPATQLAMHIAPLRLDADGVHRLTVNLHPADLGPVQVVAEIRNGEINVQLSGATDAGTDALRDALDDLRRQLQDAGFTNCSLDLRQGSAQQDQARQQFAFGENARAAGGNTPAAAREAPEAVPPATPRTTGNSRLDIRA